MESPVSRNKRIYLSLRCLRLFRRTSLLFLGIREAVVSTKWCTVRYEEVYSIGWALEDGEGRRKIIFRRNA